MGTLEDTSHVLLFLLLVCQGMCVMLPSSWREEEWEKWKKRKNEKGERKMPGGKREWVKVKPGHCKLCTKEKSMTGNSQSVKFSIEG